MIPLIGKSILSVAIFANLLTPFAPRIPENKDVSDYKFDICYEGYEVIVPDERDIAEMAMHGEMERLAQLVYAEAGNQDEKGKRLVADVVLNRVEDSRFPDTIEGVIFQSGQFEPTWNGAYEKAAWEVTEECYKAVASEVEKKTDENVLYFNNSQNVYGFGVWKYGDHWFGY